MRAVCIKERTGNVNNFLSAPKKNKPRLFRYNSNGLWPDFLPLHISGIHRHSSDRRLPPCVPWDSEIAISVPSRPAYFLGTLSRSTASPGASSPIATETPPAPEIIALFKKSCLPAAEQPLELAFSRSIALLDFRAADRSRLLRMGFRGSSCTAAAVASCTSAQKNDYIPGSESLRMTASRGAAPITALFPFALQHSSG